VESIDFPLVHYFPTGFRLNRVSGIDPVLRRWYRDGVHADQMSAIEVVRDAVNSIVMR